MFSKLHQHNTKHTRQDQSRRVNGAGLEWRISDRDDGNKQTNTPIPDFVAIRCR